MIFELTPNIINDNFTASLPASKSISNRLLILASITPGMTIINNLSDSNDTKVLVRALKTLGVNIESDLHSAVINGQENFSSNYNGEIDLEDCGTAFRFMTALCAFCDNCQVILTGSKRMQERPIGDLVEGLRQFGREIEYLGKKDYPPIKITGKSKISTNTILLSGKTSSQFISALLLISPIIKGGLNLIIKDQQTSKSYIDLTLSCLEQFGIEIENKNYKSYKLAYNKKLVAGTYNVETDLSSASYFAAIAALTQKQICIPQVNLSSKQGDLAFLDILARMGCEVTIIENESEIPNSKLSNIEITGPAKLRAIKVDMNDMPDTALTLAVLACCAAGETEITGLQTLNHKETNRLKALQNEISKLGIKASITQDSIKVIGGTPKPAQIKTYDDHRIAMAFATLGSVISGMRIEDPEVVKKSFPNFWLELKKLGISVKEDNTIVTPSTARIVLIGFMGAGKTTIAKVLESKLKYPLIELDQEILKATKFGSINQLFSQKGESYFRKIEAAHFAIACKTKNAIVSPGAGFLITDSNRDILKLSRETGTKVVYLEASFSIIRQRLEGDQERPLFKDLQIAKELYDSRVLYYRSFSDFTINTDQLTINQVVDAIIAKL